VDKFTAVFFGHFRDLFQAGDRHPAAGNPQAHGEQVLAPLLDEPAGLEIVQIYLCGLLGLRH
jgi:hypothetical protein